MNPDPRELLSLMVKSRGQVTAWLRGDSRSSTRPPSTISQRRGPAILPPRPGPGHPAKEPERDLSSVLIRGKGNKPRRCPLWPRTVNELRPLAGGRGPQEHVFLNRRGEPLTRVGIHALVERYAAKLT